jgi:hypothetical protein
MQLVHILAWSEDAARILQAFYPHPTKLDSTSTVLAVLLALDTKEMLLLADHTGAEAAYEEDIRIAVSATVVKDTLASSLDSLIARFYKLERYQDCCVGAPLQSPR